MAFTATITKIFPTGSQDGLRMVGVNLLYKEDSTELINQNVTVRYRKGEDIGSKQVEVLGKCQKLIDDYEISRTYYDHAKMDNLVTYCENNIVVQE